MAHSLLKMAHAVARQSEPAHLRPEGGWASELLQSETAHFLALVLLLSFPALYYLSGFNVNDPDFGFHVRTGEWILQHHAVPRTDPCSQYGATRPWVAYSWLFDVLLYGLVQSFGLAGMALFQVAFRVVLAGAMFALARRLSGNFWRAAVVTAVAVYSTLYVLLPRPGMFTIVFTVVELYLIFAALETGRAKTLWLIPPLMALWANLHIQFVYGLAVLGVFAAEPLMNAVFRYTPRAPARIPERTLWAVLATSAAATLVNPYGWGVYSTLAEYAGQATAFRHIFELQAMNFREPTHYAVLLLGLVAAVTVGWRRDLRPVVLMMLGGAAALSFHAVKDMWVLSVVALCILAGGWEARGAAVAAAQPATIRRPWGVAICVVGILAGAWRYYGVSNDMLQIGLDGTTPEGAARFVEQHHLRGPLYNDLDWGGFLIWRLPGLPVAIDGRTNVHGDARVARFSDVWHGKPEWEADPDLSQANLIIGQRALPLTELLRFDARFQLVYEDSQAAVFVRR